MFEDSSKKVAESVFKEKLLRKLVEDSYGVTGESKNIAKFHFRLSSLFPNSYIWFQPRYLTNPYSIQSPIIVSFTPQFPFQVPSLFLFQVIPASVAIPIPVIVPFPYQFLSQIYSHSATNSNSLNSSILELVPYTSSYPDATFQ